MVIDKFEKLVSNGVITTEEKNKVYSQMKPNSDGQFIGLSDSKIDYKYYVSGNIFDDDLCDFVKNHCVPQLGSEYLFPIFNTYGMTFSGICDGWSWFTKDNITQYALKKGHKPIEEATKEELWEMLALSSMYWKGKYEEWNDRNSKKSDILNHFIGDCERKYFGYDNAGYTANTIKRILDSIEIILKDKFKQ